MIGREENQYILQQAKDFSSSIIGLEDSASFISEDTAGISIMFDFDAVLLTSRIYQQVGRSHLRQAIKVGRRPLSFEQAHKEKRSKNSSKITVIQPAGPSFRASLNGPPESSRHQAQGDTVTANMARTLSPLTRPRAQNTDDFLPDDTLEHEKSGRTLPSQQLPKAAWLPNQTIQSKSDTNSRQEQDVLGGQRSHNSKRNVLILGTSESGKSTLLKGLKLTLSEDYTTEERLLYESLIRNNLLRSIQNVVKAMDSLEIPLGDERNEWHMQTIQLTHSVTRTWKDIGRAVSALWLDSGFYTAYERRHEYELDDNTLYYAAAVERLSEANYVPTNLDILWHRKRTSSPSGIQLLDKDYVGGAYRFVDVGGSRPQRKKWIQSFANISTVLFTIDTTSYARRLAEDKRVNRMQDQLKTFKAVGNSWWFTNSNFILLFTKMDQLEDWLAREPPKRYFPGFTDPSSQPLVEHYMQYLEELFISTIPSKKIRSRIQTIRVNLLDIENEKPLMKVVEMLDYLSMMYPEMSGYSEAEWHMV
jgi:guanine nucleotide-binding protein subunit alpha